MADRWQDSLCAPFLSGLPITGLSISVVGDGRRESTISATDPIAVALNELQFSLGEGPHWDAMRSGQPVLVPDVAAETFPQWPMFGHAVRRLPVGALFSFPLTIGAVTVGVADLYRTTAGQLSALHLSRASDLAASSATPAALNAMLAAADDAAPPHGQAPELRREVQQATGMILVQLNVSATEAFYRLKSHAFATERSLLDVAHDVVTRQLDFRQMNE